MINQQFTIISEQGLHARPAAALVGEANRFKSELALEFNTKRANLKSILGVMSIGIPVGSTIIISADGVDEEAALQGTAALLQTHGMIDS